MKHILNALQWIFAFLLLLFAIVMFPIGGKAVLGGVLLFSAAFFVSPLFNKVIKQEDLPAKKIFQKVLVSLAAMIIGIGAFYPSNKNADNLDADRSVLVSDTTTDSTEATTSDKEETTTTETVTTAETEMSTTEQSTTTTTTKATTTTTTTTTTPSTTTTTTATTKAVTTASSAKMIHFILNTDSYCIHTKASCRAAQQILPENYREIDIKEDELYLYGMQYWACGICARKYTDILPKF